MEHDVLTIGKVARQLLENFTKENRQNSSPGWLFQSEEDWQHRIIADVWDSPILTREAYSAAFRVLLEIFVAENEEQAEEFLWDIEPSAKESELTAWLNASPEHLRYLTFALQENNVSDGGDVLRKAYKLYLQDIGKSIIRNISNFISQQETFEKAVI